MATLKISTGKRSNSRNFKPFFKPKLEDFFDTQYFENTANSKNKALYITKKYQTESEEDSKEEKAVEKYKKFNVNLTQEMKSAVMTTVFDQKCHPLGEFKLFRINQMLKDF